MNFLIRSVDHEPDDLRQQLPLRGRLLRRITGPPRRAEYWLTELTPSVSWTREGSPRTVRFLVLTARWEGMSVGRRGTVAVNIWYVIDDTVAGAESFNAAQAEFVAIGMARVSKLPIWCMRLWTIFSSGT